MSAAATAAGYLYASGRLRGRSKEEEPENKEASKPPAKRRQIRIAAIPEPVREKGPAPRTRPAPRIEYRVRRWRPE